MGYKTNIQEDSQYIKLLEKDVGIGTTAPSSKLHILDNSFSVNPAIRVTHDPGFSPQSIEVSAGAFDGGGTIAVDTNAILMFKRGTSESMRITGNGSIGVGTTSPDASALLDMRSTTQGFLPPAMLQSERDAISSPANGLMIFNRDTEEINVFTSSNGWRAIVFQ